ncbi:MAG TPA: amidohydrolase family protein, partial [Saprospiraceae bacterium]|nr:amidohydrolase family protein [Saprospiraceae bacterium]
AYKYEVIDAIPHNSGILHDMGITTAINSDDAEMARRLNQEAAKAIKYSEMSPTEALKMVTINPAKLLHLDARMGSIKEGKDADIVIWSASPLSIYAIAEITFVDGIKFFDRNEMEQQKKLIDEERNALIQKMLAFKKSGGKTELFTSAKKIQYHCDTIGEGKEESIENH